MQSRGINGIVEFMFSIIEFISFIVQLTKRSNTQRPHLKRENFLVHITSCTPAEKSINVLLYNQSAVQPFSSNNIVFTFVTVMLKQKT